LGCDLASSSTGYAQSGLGTEANLGRVSEAGFAQALGRLYGLADVLVYSYEVGIEKPDQPIYEITCERLDVHNTRQAVTDLEACLAEPAG